MRHFPLNRPGAAGVACLFALALAWAVPGLAGAQEAETASADDAAAGPAIWASGTRPNPGLWLVIDDGRGPRLVVARQSNAVASLLTAARGQGMELALPQGGEQDDRQGLQAAWEGDGATAARLAGRYGSGELVIGRLARSGSGWQAQWQVIDSLGDATDFSRSDADALALLGAVGDSAARHFARQSNELAAAGPPGEFEIVIEGVRSAADYVRVQGYLDGLAFVRGVRPLGAQEDRLRVSLQLATGMGRFDDVVEAGSVLARASDDAATPVYRLR